MKAPVWALVISGTDVYAGGAFAVAKWDGTTWTSLGQLVNFSVHALAVSGKEVYAGGVSSAPGTGSVDVIAKWDGTRWSELSRMTAAVWALATSGSDLYAGGDFTRVGITTPANGIAKWDGSSWTPLGSGVSGSVRVLAVSGNTLYAGGLFTTAGGNAARNIAKWDGSGWTGLGLGLGAPSGLNDEYVLGLALSGSDVYAGGKFRIAGGRAATNIAKWDGTEWTALGSGMNGAVYALAVLGNDLYAGGFFQIAGDKVSPYIARAYSDLPTLSILRAGDDVTVSWPASFGRFVLQENPNVANTTTWFNASYPLTTNGATKSAIIPIGSGNHFFRLTGD